jgi:hypothetical protein
MESYRYSQNTGKNISFACDIIKYNIFNILLKGDHYYQVNEANLGVKDSSGNNLEVQYVDVDDVTKDLRKLYVNAYLGLSPKQAPKYWLLFQVSIPPLGWSTYFISKAAGKSKFRIIHV